MSGPFVSDRSSSRAVGRSSRPAPRPVAKSLRSVPPAAASGARFVSARVPVVAVAAVVLGTLLAILGAGESRAAAVCSNTLGANDWIHCTESGSSDIDIDLSNPAISTSGAADEGIWAEHTGTGDIDIDVTDGSIEATTAAGLRIRHDGARAIEIDLTRVAVSTEGARDPGVYAQHRGSGGTGIDIDLTGGSVTTIGSSAYAVAGNVNAAGGASVSIDVTDAAVSTAGLRAYGIHGVIGNVASTASTSVSIDVKRGSIATTGEDAHGVYGLVVHSSSKAALSVDVMGAVISTRGSITHGIYSRQSGEGGIETDLTDVAISTTNTSSYGFFGLIANAGSRAALDVDVAGGSVRTTGARSHGIVGYVSGLASTAAISIETADDSVIAVEGPSARGLLGIHAGLGSVSMVTGAATAIKAPFAVGMEARLMNDASAAGRIVVAHEGTAEAWDVGVLAWARRSGGYTFGDGAQTADDAGRTAPMIHVTSGGTVTAGAAARDAFISNRIAGADGTLSAAESAVLAAVTAGDSNMLDTALGALPAAYDDDYRTEARNLLNKRSAAPSSAAALARRAAEEILGLSRAGVRAQALSHTAIADHIRQGDRDPAILAVDEASRTEQQRAALAEQEKLSAAERTVLKAVLEGSGLEAALAAISGAAYTDAWKDGVRERAASYNAGDVRVDVTGGSISAEGNGVEALYAVPHDRNGAIAVTVAAGTTVTGGAAGIYVTNAGLDAGGDGEADDIRRQVVTVNGLVTGGTDAAVHLVGGGKLTVGAMGRVLAGSSGVAILVNDPGRSEVVIDGLVRGGAGGEAAVRLSGGGTVTVGLNGRVEANGAANAVLADLGTTAATLRAEVADTAMPWRDEAAAAAARVDGKIVGVGDSMVFLLVDGEGRTGMSRTVPLVEGRPDLSVFPERPEEEGPDRMLCGDATDGRCRLYEALPSALLSMNGLPTYRERMSSARGGNGGWARVDTAAGKWKAARSTQDDVSYNRSRTGVRAGVDMAVGEEGLVGLSAHGLTGSAKMTGDGGKVAMTGIGLGLNATARTADGIHVDGQLAVTRYKAKLTSGTGTKLQDGAKGTGYALALEAGRSMSAGGGVSVTPRAGLAWSQVSLRGFTDTRGAAVSMRNARSFTGSVGVDVETSPAAAGPALFGSLDVTREFTKNTETRLPGTMLKATAAATSLRVGAGARFDLGDGASMLGSAAYETAGGGNNEFGGALSFTARF